MGASTEEQLTQKEQEIEATRARLSRDTDELGDKVNPQRIVQRRTEAAKGRLSSLRERVMGTASSARHSAESGTRSVAGTASDAVSAAGDRAHAGAHKVQSTTEGNPLAAGLVAFGAGMVISAMFPATEKEKHVGQTAVETVRDHGQPLMDQAKSVGSEVSESLKEHATSAAREVKSTAQEAAENVKGEAKSSAQNVKEEARPQQTDGTGTASDRPASL